jgi:hypothetical protein
MKNLIKLEELFLFGLSIYLFARLDYPWWLYPLLFLAPDISMLGYLGGPRTGALVYNLVHHRALSIGMYTLGLVIAQPVLQCAGLILFGHSSLDRVFGYGLKHADSFQNTHLGMIGNGKN